MQIHEKTNIFNAYYDTVDVKGKLAGVLKIYLILQRHIR